MKNFDITTREEMIEAVVNAGPDWVNIINPVSCKFDVSRARCRDLEGLTRNRWGWPDLNICESNKDEPQFVDFPIQMLYFRSSSVDAKYNTKFVERDEWQCCFCEKQVACQLEMFDHIFSEHKRPTRKMRAWYDNDRLCVKSRIILREEELDLWRRQNKTSQLARKLCTTD